MVYAIITIGHFVGIRQGVIRGCLRKTAHRHILEITVDAGSVVILPGACPDQPGDIVQPDMPVIRGRIFPIPDKQVFRVPVIIGDGIGSGPIEIIDRGKTVATPESQFGADRAPQLQSLDRRYT